jgi:predicted phage terminase large subunit-like protein
MADPKPSQEEQLRAQLRVVERTLRVKRARDSLMDFTCLTMPDPADIEDATLSRYRPATHHYAIVEALEMLERGEILRLIICLPPRHGKALEVDTPIPTPDGWREIGQLKIGDLVFNETGEAARVLATSRVMRKRPVYRVTTDDGHCVVADAEHEWFVRLCRKYKTFSVKTTKYLAERTCDRRPLVAPHGALRLPEADVPIDPYVLGVWLGDGCTHHATITADDGDAAFIRAEIERRGFRTSDRATDKTFGVLGLQAPLRQAGLLGRKFVPPAYLRASEGQRRDLLRGLIDTDGHVAPDGQVEFCNTNHELAQAVRELVHSLGHKASLIEGRAMLGGRDCGAKWRVMFYAADVALLPRKAAKCRDGTRSPGRFLSFEPCGLADTVCIQVEGGMFLAGAGMVPTHNSELSSRRLIPWFAGRDPYREIIFSTYSQEFADDFGRSWRGIIDQAVFRQIFPGLALRKDSRAVDRMELAINGNPSGGALVAVGAGGAVTGRGADLLALDDIFKNFQEADSPTIREQRWKWFIEDAMTRLMPGGRVVITMTRRHEDDIVGRLVDPANEHYDADEAASWTVLELPAIKDGKALWPERYPMETLLPIQRRDPRSFAALYQQKPAPDDGMYFKREQILGYRPDELPKNLRKYAASDHALTTKQENDATCMGAFGVDQGDHIWILPDLVWERMETDKTLEEMIALMVRHRPLVWWAEDEHINKSLGPFRRKRMQEEKVYTTVDGIPSVRDLRARARSIQGRMAMKMVHFPTFAPWWPDAQHELLRFPAGTHDDFVSFMALVGLGMDMEVAAPLPKAEGNVIRPRSWAWLKASDEERRRQEQQRKAAAGW